jgi:hypothetical protein
MRFLRFGSVLLLALSAVAQAPLPELRIEPTGGGSILHIKNTGPQPLTAYLIELVNYPGSSFSLFQDDVAAEVLAPGAERSTTITNMTVGAVPDYVKMQAAVYADGSTAGIPEKAKEIVERRRALVETTRELIRRLGKGESATDLKQWSDSLPAISKANRSSQEAINQTAVKGLISGTAADLKAGGVDKVLEHLKASERAMAASKPAL